MTKSDRQISERTKSEAKTTAILSGAMKEFLQNGYAGTSMDKVAKSARVSKATVYSHFGDKENLFNAVMQDLVKDKFQQVMSLEKPQSLEQDPQVVLSGMMTKMLANIQNNRSFQDFMRIIIGESGRFPELAKAYVNNVAKPTIEILTKYLKSHPALELADPEATVRVMMGTMVYFVMLQEMLHGKDIVPLEGDRVIKTLTDLITEG
ncbi:TetR/AcrR family transcriptional regulator [Waterburya agarophytonicola K14]|uniref:TetR/AcrR family transcriptional regulator n=1 Tax=Waterburya agarophytonicola KI4 TaxID=2874699 RepID=A0A964FFD4_9CYAN|nr:TetR/AcrR family transcriptional regulator [Waterburya agarophytonicola]MCC0176847.1 TetR/AcrR family transcriptional regulator [Waterburya agarophytonicola KI4]